MSMITHINLMNDKVILYFYVNEINLQTSCQINANPAHKLINTKTPTYSFHIDYDPLF